ncbi:MAG: FG-GAP repeat protein, partial [Wenzhouxiangella sp.]|nr:FG-GAP repeat protein [Wenzhouxiangella sp.]
VFVRNEEGQWSQQAYLKPSNTDAGDQFGFSVAASGDTVLVGSFRESSASGGDQQDNSAQWAGAAYVFVRDAEDIWSQQAYLKASNPDEIDYFGESVGLSGDAAIVGAYTEDSASTGVDGDQTDNSASDSGAVYAFVRGSSGAWSQLAYLKASNAEVFDRFGRAVAVSGSTIVAAADTESSGAEGVDGHQDNNDVSGSGAVYLFTPPDRELEVTRIGQGQVISDPAGIQCPSNCQIDFPFDIQVELSAIAAPGWRFDQWAGGCTGSGSCQVTMDEDRLVGARFIRQRTLAVVISGQGRVTSQQPGIDCPETCEAEFDQDSEVLLIATPEPGWVFSSWGGGASSCGSSLQCTVTLDANRTAGALFEVVEDRVFRDRFEVRD